jgi:transposase
MSTLRYQKRGNKYYVYEVTQYWDKELKKPRQKTKYLGNSDTLGGEYSKTGRKEAAPKEEKAIVDFGDSFVISQIAKNEGLLEILSKSFGVEDKIMSLVCYQITCGSAMHNMEDWMEGNIAKKLFPLAQEKSQDISRLIRHLGKEELQQAFFKNYIAKFFPNPTGILIDSTSLPSAINASINAFGHTSQGIEENVTCLMLVDKKSSLPLYFRGVGGDIADTSTLKTTIREIKNLGLKADSAVLDAGYCSKENLKFMVEENIDFVTRLPRSHGVFYDLVDGSEIVQNYSHAQAYGERTVFISSKQAEIYGQTLFAHVILDLSKKAKETNNIHKENLGKKLTEKEIETINFKLKYAGFLVLLSKSKIEKQDVLPTYYTRQAIEQIFGFAKSGNDILPLRVHSQQSINGYLMLVFIALIIYIKIRQKLLLEKTTVEKALIQLRGLKAKIYDNEIVIGEPNKKVKDIAKALKIIMPTTLGV